MMLLGDVCMLFDVFFAEYFLNFMVDTFVFHIS
jgi:hypothetical protein